ncbi:hydroxyacid oxidase 1-like isoform X2 [Belonocnema kinseyi]|uniref:hydroxyacid oxidase 1-like isoform X2 n=1 Tax=Belonocnema kinseyi TaxID=2817044 RepID=UPI00143D58B5|nr:hydroxyacid oxidase 1-like isoform X2 [Belonocnema kinseyi]
MKKFVCVNDYEEQALKVLTPLARDYYKDGAGEEISLKLNKEAFNKIRILPRMLRDVTKVDLSTTVLGEKVSMPLGIAPTALQRMAHPDGECANAKAAEAAGTIFTLSTISTSSIEEVAAAAPKATKWLQLYVFFDRNLTLELVHRAEKAGFKALVLTVDAPSFGDRRNEMRNNFNIPLHLKYANIEEYSIRNNVYNRPIHKLFDKSLSWEDVSWLKSQTRLPIVIKGILTVEDALLSIKYGASAIQVSNHGARQVDGVPASIEVLPEIVQAVEDKLETYIDGGITQGTDVFKALALGAKMAFVGRPMLWALACDGENGSKDVLEILRREILLTFSLSGCRSVKEVTKNFVCHESRFSHL